MTRYGSGLFTLGLVARLPLVPAVESDGLQTPDGREDFFERVFALKRYRDFLRDDASRAGLVRFHTRHKMLVLARSPHLYRELGRLVADIKRPPPGELRTRYGALLAAALARPATRSRHVNTLQHLAGFLKSRMTAAEKEEVIGAIGRFGEGRLPRTAATALLRRLAERYEQPYLLEQTYLAPDPRELALRVLA
jgi:uncharacterized protein YbgA (DUF1722 family)